MSVLILNDGTGTKLKAKVDDTNRLWVRSVSSDAIIEASVDGFSFSGGTDFVSVTETGAFTGLWYIVNGSASDSYSLGLIRVSNSAGITQAKLFANPTAGTTISGGSAVTMQSLNFSESQTCDVTMKKGASGQTITDGQLFSQFQIGAGSADRFDAATAIILGPGDSLGLLVKPSETSVIASTVIVYKR